MHEEAALFMLVKFLKQSVCPVKAGWLIMMNTCRNSCGCKTMINMKVCGNMKSVSNIVLILWTISHLYTSNHVKSIYHFLNIRKEHMKMKMVGI